MRSVHTLEWRYNCDFCKDEGVERGFMLPSEMKKHQMEKHPEQYQEQLEKDKPAVCPTCGKRFPDEKQLEIHLRYPWCISRSRMRRATTCSYEPETSAN